MTENAYRVAPPGFTSDQWEEFQRSGILIFENAIPQEDVPLFLARETGTDSDADVNFQVPLRIRKRKTMPEKLAS